MRPVMLGYDAANRPVRIGPEQRNAHMHIIGSSGSGKSKFLEWLMRGDLQNRQGFCLIDPHGELYHEVVRYCAHHVMKRDIILLDLSQSGSVIGFNPFQRVPGGEVQVQVDKRIDATMHAWNIINTDQTPTLERMLRLIYTVMIERNVSLPQVQHLIDFEAKTVRGHLIEQLEAPLIRKEWQELQELRQRDWRDEVLSAKNKLFRFLTSPALTRFMGVSGRSLNLQEIMDEGKVLLVNLHHSDQLSKMNARVFGALLMNEFFEAAGRRKKDAIGRDPKPYYLYVDEFQNFVSLDMADMLDQVRKRGLFLALAHQRFGQIDENITDAVLINCRIKAVFGGLSAQSARLMAEEMFINDLDPKKIKVAIYQTKFWPTYARDKVYTHSTSHSSSTGFASSTATGYSSGSTSGEFFQPGDWFSSPTLVGTSAGVSIGSSTASSSSSTSAESYSESDGVADIPILLPVPFQELSSVQYYSLEEQLTELTAALKEQFSRHCFIKLHSEKTQPLLVPFVRQFYTAQNNLNWYMDKLFNEQHALPGSEVDHLIESQERALLKEATHTTSEIKTELTIDTSAERVEEPPSPEPVRQPRTRAKKPKPNLYDAIPPLANEDPNKGT